MRSPMRLRLASLSVLILMFGFACGFVTVLPGTGIAATTSAAAATSTSPYATQVQPAAPRAPKTTAAPANRTAKSAAIDLNTASVDQLKQLPGIGDVRAAAIVAGRPYKSVDDLAARKIVPQSTLDRIRARVTMETASARIEQAPLSPAPNRTTTLARAPNGFATQGLAAARCPSDVVVWANLH